MAVVAGVLVILGGCATVGHERLTTGEVLSAAGFQMQVADTPERLTSLGALPARTLVRQVRDGRTSWVYADARGCGCEYVGTAAQYQQYQRLKLERELADEQLRAAQEYGNAAATWGAWGPWGPWSWF